MLNFLDGNKSVPGFKKTGIVGVILVAVFGLLYLFSLSVENNRLIDWKTADTLHSQKVVIEQFEDPVMSHVVEANTYYYSFAYEGGDFRFPDYFQYIFPIALIVGLGLMMTSLTYVKKELYFRLGCLFYPVLILSFEFWNLFSNKLNGVGVSVLAAVIPVLMIFMIRKKSIPDTFKRFMLIIISMLAGFALIQLMSGVHQFPAYVTAFGSKVGVFFSVLLALFVGYEIIYLFFYLSNQTKGGAINLIGFLAISLIFLFNLGVVLYQKFYGGSINMVIISPMIIFVISVVAGFWGLRRRLPNYPDVYEFEAVSVLKYIGYSLISFAFVMVQNINGNDILQALMKDVFLYAFVGLSVSFFLYLLTNFTFYILENKDVQRAVFKGKYILYSFVWLGGILVFGILCANDDTVLKKLKSSISGSKADYFQIASKTKNLEKVTADSLANDAKELYATAFGYFSNNYKANYIYTQYLQRQLEVIKDPLFVKKQIDYGFKTMLASPGLTAQGLANAATYYSEKEQNKKDYLDVLRASMKNLSSESPELYSNMGKYFFDQKKWDSAGYYFSGIKKLLPDSLGEVNDIALQFKRGRYDELKSYLDETIPTYSPLLNTNLLAVANLFNRTAKGDIDFKDESEYSLADLTTVYNYVLNKKEGLDTTDLKVDELYNNESLFFFGGMIELLNFYNTYYGGNLEDAHYMLSQMIEYHNGNEYLDYTYLKAILSLKDGLVDQAADWFDIGNRSQFAVKVNYAPLYDAYLKSVMNHPRADTVWGRIDSSRLDQDIKILARNLRALHNIDPKDDSQLNELPDENLAALVYMKRRNLSESQFRSIFEKIQSEDLRYKTEKSIVLSLLDNRKYELASKLFSLIPSQHYTDNERATVKLRIALGLKEWGLAKSLITNLDGSSEKKYLEPYAKACIALHEKNYTEVEKNLRLVYQVNPYFRPNALKAMELINTHEDSFANTIDIVNKTLNNTPYDKELLEEYIRFCVKNLLNTEMTEALSDYYMLAGEEEFDELLEQLRIEFPDFPALDIKFE